MYSNLKMYSNTAMYQLQKVKVIVQSISNHNPVAVPSAVDDKEKERIWKNTD